MLVSVILIVKSHISIQELLRLTSQSRKFFLLKLGFSLEEYCELKIVGGCFLCIGNRDKMACVGVFQPLDDMLELSSTKRDEAMAAASEGINLGDLKFFSFAV